MAVAATASVRHGTAVVRMMSHLLLTARCGDLWQTVFTLHDQGVIVAKEVGATPGSLGSSGGATQGRARSNALAKKLLPWLAPWLAPWLTEMSINSINIVHKN